MQRKNASDFAQELLDLYDDFAHGRLERREFLQRASKFAAGALTAEAILASLSPNYAWAQQVPNDDPRIKTEMAEYESPRGGGKIRGRLAWPAEAEGKLPAVLVVHENRGLNPYIEDVARRLGAAGFLALAPDALTPLGGYPGNDDEGRQMQRRRDGEEMTADFMAGAEYLQEHSRCSGKVGVVGFCFGGGMANTLAVQMPEVIDAAVAFYGRQPDPQAVSKIKAAMQLHYAELDQRINAGWADYKQALDEADVTYQAYFYDGVNHGFHNDTTPRYDQQAAELAWQRTIDFFNKHL